MLEFFDESEYEYSIKIGVYMSKNYYTGFANKDYLKYYIIDESEYDLSADKPFTLFVGLLKFISILTKENFKDENIRYSDRMNRNTWISDPRNRALNLPNSFSDIKLLQPCVYLIVNHKEKERYYNDGYQIDNGWTSKDIGGHWYQNSIISRMKKRFSNFGINVDISTRYNNTSYSNKYDENWNKLDVDPILISTIIEFKIKI